MEMIKNVLNIIKAHTIKREVKLPNGKDAFLLLDSAGNETLVTEKTQDFRNTFSVASAADIVEFAKTLPLRYGMERAVEYRELYVHVNDEDIPMKVRLCDRADQRKKASVYFDFKMHRDFKRWMNAKNMSQLDFRTLLLELADQHDQPDLAGLLSIIKYRTEIEYEASIETERNFKLAFSENEAKGSVDIPKLINVSCPVISGTKHYEDIQFEVVIRKPKPESGEKIKFSLVPYGKDMTIIFRAAALEVTQSEFVDPVQAALSDFTQILPVVFVREWTAPDSYGESDYLTEIKS